MKITGSVPLDEVPEGQTDTGTRGGVWTTLVEHLLSDHQRGQATRIEVADRKELTRVRNATLHLIRDKHKMRLLATYLRTPENTLDVYLTLEPLEAPVPEPAPPPPPTVLGRPRGRPRKTG